VLLVPRGELLSLVHRLLVGLVPIVRKRSEDHAADLVDVDDVLVAIDCFEAQPTTFGALVVRRMELEDFVLEAPNFESW
jgi:hypothetical protein